MASDTVYEFTCPDMAESFWAASDVVIKGANFTFTFYWLPALAKMTVRIANDVGSLFYGNLNLLDPVVLHSAVPDARTNTDLLLMFASESTELATPATMADITIQVHIGRF
jgi:hypothetical protein